MSFETAGVTIFHSFTSPMRTKFVLGCDGARRRGSPLLRAPRRGRSTSPHEKKLLILSPLAWPSIVLCYHAVAPFLRIRSGSSPERPPCPSRPLLVCPRAAVLRDGRVCASVLGLVPARSPGPSALAPHAPDEPYISCYISSAIHTLPHHSHSSTQLTTERVC